MRISKRWAWALFSAATLTLTYGAVWLTGGWTDRGTAGMLSTANFVCATISLLIALALGYFAPRREEHRETV